MSAKDTFVDADKLEHALRHRIRDLTGTVRRERLLFRAVEREVARLRMHIQIGAKKGRQRRRLRDEALVAYMSALSTPQRDAAFLRTYSKRIREGTAAAWEIPNTVATTLDDIALRIESTMFSPDEVTLHSGECATWKIECDRLGFRDFIALSRMLLDRVEPFGRVEGVPRGGLGWAETLSIGGFCSDGPLLIVDDVLTTGASIEQHRAGRAAIGAVIFARGPCPAWVTPLFTLAPMKDGGA